MEKHALSFSYFLFNNDITHVLVPILPIYAIRIPVQFTAGNQICVLKSPQKAIWSLFVNKANCMTVKSDYLIPSM